MSILWALSKVIPIKVNWGVLGFTVLVTAIGLVGWQIDSKAFERGFSESDAQWGERLEIELRRQDAANQRALQLAQIEIQQLQEAKDVLDATVSRITQSVLEDPDADNRAIGTSSVQRLNSILD